MAGKSTIHIGWVPKGMASPPALKTSYDIWSGALPTSIRVIRPPNQTIYAPGEAIDMTGAHIFAYDDNNTIVCRIPLNEITIDPTVAPSGDGSAIVPSKTFSDHGYSITLYNCTEDTMAYFYFYYGGSGLFLGWWPCVAICSHYTQTIEFSSVRPDGVQKSDSISVDDIWYNSDDEIDFFYGLMQYGDSYNTRVFDWEWPYFNAVVEYEDYPYVSVKWERPMDKKVLKTKFKIDIQDDNNQ